MANTPAPIIGTGGYNWDNWNRGADTQQPFGVQLGAPTPKTMSPQQFQQLVGGNVPSGAPIGMNANKYKALTAPKPVAPAVAPPVAPVTTAPPMPPSMSNVPANPTATGQATHQEIQGLTLEQWRNIQRMLGMAPSV